MEVARTPVRLLPQGQKVCRVPAQTPAQQQMSQSGNRDAYFQSRLDAGDPFAYRALMTVRGADLWGSLANGRLFVSILERNNASVDLTMGLAAIRGEQNQIGVELMQAYSRQLDATGGMTLGLWTDVHHDVFSRHDLPPETYGGTPFGGYGITLMNAIVNIDGCL